MINESLISDSQVGQGSRYAGELFVSSIGLKMEETLGRHVKPVPLRKLTYRRPCPQCRLWFPGFTCGFLCTSPCLGRSCNSINCIVLCLLAANKERFMVSMNSICARSIIDLNKDAYTK